MKFVDENQRIGTAIAARLDQIDRITDHGIKVDPSRLGEFPGVGFRDQPDGFSELR
ncbi:hypothetical protein D3C71_991420 [compost metagenome]